ncbi:hypothetical protein ACFSHT_08970 [Paraburkholderia silviterrae]|uniref:Uncharacterized protein n=1 Tax=Paraburkholderia silviterrae TaxID=2528715 RepID=A0A4R5ME28_9BURK|nr:hypothetical protein [Paraburkholderia silviterrae]TDG25124.1 hypothetical protein EYW47_04480 [Paraburkholderia silviterrae]
MKRFQRIHGDDCVSVRMPSLVVDALRENLRIYDEDDDRFVTAAVVQLLLRGPNARVSAKMLPFDHDSAKRVLSEHPTLGTNGFADDDKHAQTGFNWDVVELAVLWLALMHSVFGRESGSYSLKHEIEQSIGRHVANGEAILAALLLPGFYRVRRAPGRGNPNAIIRPEPQQ